MTATCRIRLDMTDEDAPGATPPGRRRVQHPLDLSEWPHPWHYGNAIPVDTKLKFLAYLKP